MCNRSIYILYALLFVFHLGNAQSPCTELLLLPNHRLDINGVNKNDSLICTQSFGKKEDETLDPTEFCFHGHNDLSLHLFIHNIFTRKIDVKYNKFDKGLQFSNSTYQYANIDSNYFANKDSSVIEVMYCNIERLTMVSNYIHNISLRESNIINFRVELSDSVNSLDTFTVQFENSILGKSIAIAPFGDSAIRPNANIVISYKKVSFEKYYSIALNESNLGQTRIEFININKIETPIEIPTPIDSDRVTLLTIINTDPTNLLFDYLGKYKLVFPNGTPNDVIKSTYERVLSKFRTEGREDSYQKLDIEYRQYKNSTERCGALQNFCSSWWNNYEYDKWYILIWIPVVLLIFTAINCIPVFWQSLLKTFEIDELHKEYKWERQSLNWIKYLIYVFIYTATVFFSFRLDIGKLRYKKKGILALFFFEYVVGIVLTAFLANFIITY